MCIQCPKLWSFYYLAIKSGNHIIEFHSLVSPQNIHQRHVSTNKQQTVYRNNVSRHLVNIKPLLETYFGSV